MLKYVIILQTAKLLLKKFIFFFIQCKNQSSEHDKKANKSNFYKDKKLLSIYDIEVDMILISKKEPYGKKSSFRYFLGYNDDGDDVIRRLRNIFHK